jgi:hypothetical protein
MSSARVEASRKNGAKSRGPTTTDGKAKSAQNALKHGLRAQKYLVLPEEDAAEFAALEASLIEELAPVGVLQTVLARRVAVAAWRLERADRLEAEVLEFRSYEGANAGLALIRDGNATRSFETLLRYRGAAMAEFWRALKTLKALQAEPARDAGQALADAPALQAEQALGTRPAVATPPLQKHAKAPAARPALADRARPNEPEHRFVSAPEPRLQFPLPARAAPGALHEPAAAWAPNEPESGAGRHAASPTAS